MVIGHKQDGLNEEDAQVGRCVATIGRGRCHLKDFVRIDPVRVRRTVIEGHVVDQVYQVVGEA